MATLGDVMTIQDMTTEDIERMLRDWYRDDAPTTYRDILIDLGYIGGRQGPLQPPSRDELIKALEQAGWC